VVAHQLSHTPQVDSIFNVPAGKDNLCADLYVANGGSKSSIQLCRPYGGAPIAESALWAARVSSLLMATRSNVPVRRLLKRRRRKSFERVPTAEATRGA
jgi:hypothetical protein